MAHRKWKESKQQPSMLPGPAVPGCCLISFHFLWAIHPIRPCSKSNDGTRPRAASSMFLVIEEVGGGAVVIRKRLFLTCHPTGVFVQRNAGLPRVTWNKMASLFGEPVSSREQFPPLKRQITAQNKKRGVGSVLYILGKFESFVSLASNRELSDIPRVRSQETGRIYWCQ